MITGHDVAECARGLLGTPWMHQQRSPGMGMDCVGLVICVARKLGLVAPAFDVGGYSRIASGQLEEQCAQHMTALPGLTVGAVALLQSGALPHHVAIVGQYHRGGYSLIHALSSIGKVVETRWLIARNQRRVGVYALPGVDYQEAVL